MCWMLSSVKNVLEKDFGLKDVLAAKKLMGVWHERSKLASIGVGLNHFVTEHGLALNLVYDEEMFNELKRINPCGMDSKIYTSLDQIIGKSEQLVQSFDDKFKLFLAV